MTTGIPRTWVPGTPRGFGDNKVAAIWLRELEATLGEYRDQGEHDDPRNTRYAVTLEFRIWPDSPKYRGQNRPHGTDVDNLVKQTLDGLTHTRSKDLPPGLNVITNDRAVYRLLATKDHVGQDQDMGVFVTVERF